MDEFFDSVDADFQLNQKIYLLYYYSSYKNNFDKIFLYSDRILKSKCIGK